MFILYIERRGGLVIGLLLVYNILVSIDPYGIMLTDI